MISLIVAMARNRVIGRNNQLPWHLPEDLKRFKQITMGHPILMGRKTYESIGRPLPGRENVVVSRNPHYHPEGVVVEPNLIEALEKRKNEPEIFIIGGSQLFAEGALIAERIYLTLIERDVEGDVFFPEINWDNDYIALEKTEVLISPKENIPYSFATLQKR